MTKKLTPFVLPSSGVTIQTVPISLNSIVDSMKREEKWEEPEPPLVKIEIAGQERFERNWADPDFPAGHQIWENKLQQEAMNRLLKRIALKQPLTKEQLAEVQEYREVLGEAGLPTNDKVLWLYEMAIGNDSDIEALIKFVTGQIDPQEENIEKKQETTA